MNDIISESFSKYTNKKFSWFNAHRLLKSNPDFRLVYHILQGGDNFRRHKKLGYMFHKFLVHRLKEKYGCYIPCETLIGEGFQIVHHGGIVVNQGTRIGKNFKIRQNTTIGNDGLSNENSPVIGDDVTVFANVVIFGKIKIGDNVVIGAGSVVCKDVPSNSMVVGNPARVIKRFNEMTGQWERCDESKG